MVNSPSFGYFMVGTLSASSGGALSYTNSSNTIMKFNTLAGLSGFSIINQSNFNFNVTITEPNNMNVVVLNSFSQFKFNYMVVLTLDCSNSTTPHLLANSTLCYDICPARYFTDTQALVCSLCSYDCYTCNSTRACLSCNSTTDFRQLN
jgi:hypothetical protein